MADDSVNITIDGQRLTVSSGQTILELCRKLGKDIPTLCHHDGVEPYTACRVCLVEIVGQAGPQLVPSCQCPISDGMVVETDSKAVRDARRVVLELLLARCPGSEVVADLAARYGVTQTPYPTDDPDETCILCGLCVRICQDVLGIGAIGFFNRGIERTVGVPFDEASEVCIGCGACVAVCPTGHVLSIDDALTRRMETWKTQLELVACESCGRRFATLKHTRHVYDKLPRHVREALDEKICPRCRRSQTVERISKASCAAAEQAGSASGGVGDSVK